jgi:hypothetical protein
LRKSVSKLLKEALLWKKGELNGLIEGLDSKMKTELQKIQGELQPQDYKQLPNRESVLEETSSKLITAPASIQKDLYIEKEDYSLQDSVLNPNLFSKMKEETF